MAGPRTGSIISPGGFRWIDPDDADHSVLSFLHFPAAGRPVAGLANLTPVPRHDYRIGLPQPGRWAEILNSDSADFGGSNMLAGAVTAQAPGWNDLDYSAAVTLPPLGVVWLAHDPEAATLQGGSNQSGDADGVLPERLR